MTSAPQPSGGPNLHQLTTPKAAALAGVLFAVLMLAVLIHIGINVPNRAPESTLWLAAHEDDLATAAKLMPFAGIAFLWFVAVVRDGFGKFEDRFFTSVFLGSALLFLAMSFIATAVAAALVATSSDGPVSAARAEVIAFGTTVVVAVSKTYAIRMAAVFMMSLATIWRKTGLMPRWLVVVSYLVALGLLIASDVSMWLTLAFPIWVLVVSILLLVRSGVIREQRVAGGPS